MQRVCEHIWRADTHLKMLPGFELPLSMTVVKTPAGLILHSPIRIDDTLAKEIAAVGEPSVIIAPNLFHHLYAAAAKRRYPDATVYGPAKLAKKNPKLANLVPLESCTGEQDPTTPWTEHLEVIALPAVPIVHEFMFYHHASKTLLLTDLVFNLEHAHGWIAKLYLRWSDALGKPMQTKTWRWFMRDRGAMKRLFVSMLERDIERVCVAHGAVIEADAKQQLRNAWAWTLEHG